MIYELHQEDFVVLATFQCCKFSGEQYTPPLFFEV